MNLEAHIEKWWAPVNLRRQTLIARKRKKKGLTVKQDAELKMLQGVAGLIMEYGSLCICGLCGKALELRDRGGFPTHDCKKVKKERHKHKFYLQAGGWKGCVCGRVEPA